ncbi:hypothetical protein B1L11_34775 [Microbispora sp. GKU 823]|nr:hypothetical protein B1L11_34775 [Microbispora sp. GKU 823]
MVGAAVRDPVTVYGGTGSVRELAHEGNRVPDVAALDARRLVVAWRAGAADPVDPTPTDQGAITYARSGDGGRTWTTGTLAADTSTHRYHYAVFLKDGDALLALLGRITIAADRDAAGNVDGFPVTMVARRSTDGGRTWADHPLSVAVPPNSRGVVVAGKPLRHEGVWLVPYWQAAGGTTRAGVLRSADLVTWTPGALADNPPGLSVEEPQVVVAQDDPRTLLMIARTLHGGTAADKDAHYRTHAAYAATATSTDGGLTWSAFAVDPELPNYYVKTFFAKDSLGRYLTVYNTLAGPFTGPRPRSPTSIARSSTTRSDGRAHRGVRDGSSPTAGGSPGARPAAGTSTPRPTSTSRAGSSSSGSTTRSRSSSPASIWPTSSPGSLPAGADGP